LPRSAQLFGCSFARGLCAAFGESVGCTPCLCTSSAEKNFSRSFHGSCDNRWQLIIGKLAGQPVIAVTGAGTSQVEPFFHLQFVVRLCKLLGIRSVVFASPHLSVISNEPSGAGRPQQFAFFKDHVNMTGTNPLFGHNEDRWGARFPDMNGVYRADWRKATAEAIAAGLCHATPVGVELPAF